MYLLVLLALPLAPCWVIALLDYGHCCLQVQQWIMRAIGSKLIEGKIDQVAGTVTITRCHHRTFTSSEWQGLGQQLTALREALQGANDMLLAKQAAGSRAAAAGRPGAAQPVH